MIQAIFTVVYAVAFPLWVLRRVPGWKGVAMAASGAILISAPVFIALAYIKKLVLVVADGADPARYVDSAPTAMLIVVVVSPVVATVTHLLRSRPS